MNIKNTVNNTAKNKSNKGNHTAYSTFAVLFYINRQKIKKNGMCPLMGRVSINAEVAQFSTGIDIRLSELEEKINRCLEEQKTVTSTHKQVDISPALKANKDEIIAEIKERYKLLGMHGDSNYAAINQNIKTVRDILKKVGNVVIRIRKQQRESVEQAEPQKESVEPQKEETTAYFNFRFFKVRKTSLVIAILGLLVFLLTLFSMKQQNDYSLLMEEYHKQRVAVQGLDGEQVITGEKPLKVVK